MEATGRIGTDEEGAREDLRRAVGELGSEVPERRHEALVEWAEEELGLERAYAEKLYALAQEERLEPLLAFELVRTGLGVRELEQPEQDMDEGATQQAPPDWVAEDAVELDDVALERRLRASFRRLRSHLESSDTPVAAVESYLADPDVGLMRMG